MTTYLQRTESLPVSRITSGDSIEALLLGCVLRNPGSLDDAVPKIEPDHFRHDSHQRIWRAIVAVWQSGKIADLVTVSEELGRRGDIEEIGGYRILAEIWDRAWIGMPVDQYVDIVRDYSLLRGLESAGQAIAFEAQNPCKASKRILEDAERRIFALAETGYDASVVTLGDAVCLALEEIDKRAMPATSSVGMANTGIQSLDRLLAGLHPSELIVVGARPSVGKTAFAMSILRAVIDQGVFSLFCSIEQASVELGMRFLVAESGVDAFLLRHGKQQQDDVTKLGVARDQLVGLPLVIDDSPRQSILRIAANARRLKRRKNLGLVVVDYLGLIEPSDRKQPRHEQVADISRSLKAIARDLAIPVVVLCQLNRNIENRGQTSKPRLSDLRESGQVEQDADVVILLHREDGNPDLLNIEVAKQRNGPTGEITVRFDRARMRFTDTVGEGVFDGE